MSGLSSLGQRLFALFALLPVLLLAMCVADGPAEGAVPRGINVSAIDVAPNQPADPGAIAYYKSRGLLDYVDIRVTAEQMQPTRSGPLDPKAVASVQSWIKLVGAAGGRPIINLQNFGRAYGAVLGTSGYSCRQYGDLGLKLARAFPSVVLEMMNEPHDQDTGSVIACENAFITAVRSTGDRSPLIVSIPSWSNIATFARGSAGYDQLANLYDPALNLWIELHVYFDAGSQGQSGDVVSAWNDALQAVIDWQRAHPTTVQGWAITEFATRGDQLDTLRSFLAKIDAAPDVFKVALWWGTGGNWRAAYPYRLDPATPWWDDQAAPADRGRPWSFKPEQPQVEVLAHGA